MMGIPTQATQIATLFPSNVRLDPKRARSANPIRQTIIQLATTTAGPWSLAVIMPCGG